MNKALIILSYLLFASRCYAMDLPAAKKLYAKDFKKLGVTYTTHLIFDSYVDRSLILEPARRRTIIEHPDYEPEPNNARYISAIKNGYQAALYLKYINDAVGHGVFADAGLKKGDIVGEYTGTVITQQKTVGMPADQTSYMFETIFCYRGVFSPEPLIIDARNKGNFTRFINHSYTPNVEVEEVYSDSMWHLLLVASKLINKDQQLFINYGEGYWLRRGIKPIDLQPNP